MTPAVPAPLLTHTGVARPEWIDYNGHMLDGYYLVAFTDATEGLLAHLGVGPAYRERTGRTFYTVESHINFLREVKAGAPLNYTSQLLDFDPKRLRVFHTMIQADGAHVAATNELMLLHLNQVEMKTEPMPPDSLARVEQLYRVHAGLPLPPQAGRSVGMPKAAHHW